ncbi:unnamed protein product [Brassica oleracea]
MLLEEDTISHRLYLIKQGSLMLQKRFKDCLLTSMDFIFTILVVF